MFEGCGSEQMHTSFSNEKLEVSSKKIAILPIFQSNEHINKFIETQRNGMRTHYEK